MTIWQEQRQAAGNPSQDSEHSSVADILSNSNEVELQLRGGGSVPLEELNNPSVKYRPSFCEPCLDKMGHHQIRRVQLGFVP